MYFYFTENEEVYLEEYWRKQFYRILLFLGCFAAFSIVSCYVCNELIDYFKLTYWFSSACIVVDTVLVLGFFFFFNSLFGITLAIFVGIESHRKNAKCCYACSYGKHAYTRHCNLNYRDFVRVSFVRDGDDKVFKRKRVIFLDYGDVEKDSITFLLFHRKYFGRYVGVYV